MPSHRMYRSVFLHIVILVVILLSTYQCHPDTKSRNKIYQNGIASWYGPNFHGKKTANGEVYDMNQLTAAHNKLPFGTWVQVVNKDNGKYVIVRINDRGPFVKKRIIDLSKEAAKRIGMISPGTASVQLYILNKTINPPQGYQYELYTIQIGSFSEEKNAKIFSKTYKGSRIFVATESETAPYKVVYGSYNSRKEAEKKRNKLQKKWKTSLFIRKLTSPDQ